MKYDWGQAVMGRSWSDGGGTQMNLLWVGTMRSICVKNILINSKIFKILINLVEHIGFLVAKC